MHYKKLNPLNKAFKPPNLDKKSPSDSNNHTATTTEEPVHEKQYFSVFFSKDVKKKHKIFDEGVLVIGSNTCQIFNSEGNKIYDTLKPKNIREYIEKEEPIILGFSYYIEVNKPIAKESFESGQVFFQVTNVVAPKNIGNQHKKIQTKTQVPLEIPPDSFILCEPKETFNSNSCFIEPFLAKVMRPHQRDGVKFMLECVCGFKSSSINGCILADSMGLGKTLQSIGLIWTLLRQNPFNQNTPFLKKVIIITPVTLVKNWEKEILHWLGNNRLIPLVAIGTREDVSKAVNKFCEAHYRCLIISYESFRLNAQKFTDLCDLLILDEGHRLKNMNIKTFQTFNKVNCIKRIILTGTPLQNSFDEFFSCLSFVNPGLFSNLTTFRKVFSNPILESFKKDSSEETKNLARERSKELSKIVASMVLRRQPSILEKSLPPRHEFLIFMKLTDVQSYIYKATIKERSLLQSLQDNKPGEALPFIMALRKILNHPHILLKDDSELSKQLQKYLFQKNGDFSWDCSYKFKFMNQILTHIKNLNDPKEKIIIVSYFAQTLDMIQNLCEEKGFKIVRLDGQVAAIKRQNLVDKFNNPFSGIQVFLLCAKAGGTGLNLIGANRMILCEVDWNPSNDLQVMGRIWREGQKKPVYIYRLLTSGTMEEKILQRQIMKGNIAENVVDEKYKEFEVDSDNMKRLFEFKNDGECETYAYEENEIFELLNLSEDFSDEMTEYIAFIKERKSAHLLEESQEKNMNNLFEEENAFIGMMKVGKVENEKESNENEGDKKENERETKKTEGDHKENEGETKENEGVNKEIEVQKKESEGEKKENPEEKKENEGEKKENQVEKKENEGEKKENDPENKKNEGENKENKKNLGSDQLTENLEINSKKRKFPNENVFKIFAKMKKI